MSSREEDILLDTLLAGIEAKVANPTIVAQVTYAPESDRATCWIRLSGGEAHECIVSLPNIRLRRGNRIRVRKDGNGRYEMVGGASADDAVSGVFPPPSSDSPFNPVVPPSGPVLDEDGEPVEVGTEVLDRRPDNVYGTGGTVEEPQGGRQDPVTPPGGAGQGPFFPIDIPGSEIPWGVDDQVQDVIGGNDSFAGDIRRVPYVNHQHGHGQRPLTEWTSPDEPHFGYAYRHHTHPGLGGGSVPVREEVPVPVNTTTKLFATQYSFEPGSLLVFLNGVKQMPWVDPSTPVDQWEYQEAQVAEPQSFTFHADVVVDGTVVGQEIPDVIEIVYWRPTAIVSPPIDPSEPPPLPPEACITNFVFTRNEPQGIEFDFDTEDLLTGHAMWGNAGGWVTDFATSEAEPRTHHHLGWGFPTMTNPWTLRLRIWLTDADGRTVCEVPIMTITTGETPTGPADTTPPVISNLRLTALGATTATIAWDTSEAADGVVQYGLTAGYGSEVTASSYLPAQSVNLAGLTASTLYHYRVRARDVAGNLVWSADQTFTTPAPGTPSGSGWGATPWGGGPWGQ